MGRKLMFYGAALIALEVVVFHASNAGSLFTKGGNAAASVVRSFEGR